MLPRPSEMSCLSFLYLALSHRPVLRDCEQRGPSTRQYRGGHPSHHRLDSMRNHWGDGWHILYLTNSNLCASTLKSWLTFQFMDIVNPVQRRFLSLKVTEIKFAVQESDHSRPGVWNIVFQASSWLYDSLILIFLLRFFRFFIWCFCFLHVF